MSSICPILLLFFTNIMSENHISKAWVNADPEQYGGAGDKEDRDILDYLINQLLLRKSISPPEKYNPIELWSMFGREILDEDGQE